MRQFTALTAALAVCASVVSAAPAHLEINPVIAQPTCERTDLVIGEGPSAFTVVRRWAGDGWLTSLDAALHVDGEQAWVLTLDAQAQELVQQGEGWVSRAGEPLRVTRANGGFRMQNQLSGEVLWFDEIGTPVMLEGPRGRLEFKPAGFGIGAVEGVWGTLTVERDKAGRVTALRAPGATVSYRYTGEELTSATGPRGDEVYSYAEGRLAQAGATQVRYDEQGRACGLEGGRAPLAITYRDETEWTVSAEVTRGGQRELLRYSEDRRLLVVEGPRGLTRTTFDGRLRPVNVTHNGALVLRRSFDRNDRLTVLESPAGLTHWHYSGADTQPTKVTLPSGADVRYVRNKAGLVTLRQGPSGVERFAYDAWGGLIRHRSTVGVVTKLERDARGYCVSLERGGQLTQFTRGADGEIQSIKSADGRETNFISRGRGVMVKDERGLVYAAAYDEAGRPVAWRDASGQTQRYVYNGMGLMTRAYDTEGDLLRCSYSKQGELTSITDANGNTVRYERPEPGTVIVHDPTSGKQTLRYDGKGNLVEERRGDATIRYRHDEAGRVVERVTPEGRETIDYDAQGRVIRRSNSTTTLRYTYAPDGQLAELRNSALRASVTFSYDDHGLRSEVKLPWGTQRFERDDEGRVVAIVAGEDRVEFDLRPDGRRAAVRYPNGVKTRFSYDRERLTSIETSRGNALIDSHVYAYDASGRVTSVTDGQGQTVRYTYDARGQLLSANGDTRYDYAWDAQGNRVADATNGTQRDLELGAGNRVLGFDEQTFHYDARGALVKRVGPEGETRYRYDVDGRLREVRKADGAKVRYGYAPDGTRLWREGAEGRVFELNDGTHVLGERTRGEWVTRYVHGEQVDDLLLAQRDEGSYAYHSDLVRSVTAITGPESQIDARYGYDPFGQSTLEEGRATAWNPYRYTSRAFDAETGLYDYRARSYDPSLGRFTSPDPSGRLGGVNLYAYANNDPVRFNDPWGLSAMPGRSAPTLQGTPNVFERAVTSMDEAATGLPPGDRVAYELVRGAGDFAADTVMGVMDLFKKQTWVDLGEAIKTISEDPAILAEVGRQLGTGAVGKLEEYVDAWKNDPWKAIRMTGYGIASAATVAVGAIKAIQTISAVAKAVKASKAAKRAAEVARASRAARRGAAATSAAVAANTGRAGGAANTARKAVNGAQDGIQQALEKMRGGPNKGKGRGKGNSDRFDVNCFVAGTLVETANGRVPVETVQLGDWVLARDDCSGAQGYRQVRDLYEGESDEVITLSIGVASADNRLVPGDDPRDQTIRCTTEHPFFVVGSGWVAAEFLMPGDRLVSGTNEELVVEEQTHTLETISHYNFEVADYHTYFVAQEHDDPSVWVHNTCTAGKRRAARQKDFDSGNSKVRGLMAGEATERLGRLNNLLKNAGITDAKVGIRGSSVTGKSSKGGDFRWEPGIGKASDVDFFIESPTLTKRLQPFMKDGRLTGKDLAEADPELHKLLTEFSQQTSEQIGRKADAAAVLSRELLDSLPPGDVFPGR